MNNINSDRPQRAHAYQQLEILKASPSSRWMVIGKGRFEQISILRYIFETVKGWFGFSNRASANALKSGFVYLIRTGVQFNEFGTNDIETIQEVARRVGIIPNKNDEPEKELLDEIQKIGKKSETPSNEPNNEIVGDTPLPQYILDMMNSPNEDTNIGEGKQDKIEQPPVNPPNPEPSSTVNNSEIASQITILETPTLVDGNEVVQEKPLVPSALNPFAGLGNDIDDAGYKHNLDFIVKFPADAQITSYNGELSLPGYFLKGTEFKETVQLLRGTLSRSLKEFSEARDIALKSSGEDEIVKVRSTLEKLIHIMSLSVGIKTISNSKNYTTELELQALADDFKKEGQSSIEQYSELIDGLKNSQELSRSLIFPRMQNNVTIEEAAESLTSYCTKYCGNMEPSVAQEWITKGQTLIKSILQGSHKPPSDLNISQEELTSIGWFLMYMAIQKKQGFEEGTFMLMDPEERLFNYLENSKGVFKRASSHFVGRSPDNDDLSSLIFKSAKHSGLDILTGLLPADKRTLDFALIDLRNSKQKLLYAKFENFSPNMSTANGYDFLMHGVEFIKAQATKRLQKGGDDLPGMQKERVPDNTKDAFGKVVDFLVKSQSNPTPFKLDTAKKEAQLWGIAYMYDLIENLKKDPIIKNPNLKKAIEDFDSTIKNLDNFEFRTGREVFISISDMEKFLKGPVISEIEKAK
jgi:hypothetical protein